MTTKLKLWADAVKARDGRCLDCGLLEDLHAHHIKPKLTHPELTLDVGNGKTLCYRCHKREHENNRGPRVRREHRPQRKTLEREYIRMRDRIKLLEAQNRNLVEKLTKTLTKLKHQTDKAG